MKKYISLFFTFIAGFIGVDIIYTFLCNKFQPTTASAIVGYSIIFTIILLIIDKFRGNK